MSILFPLPMRPYRPRDLFLGISLSASALVALLGTPGHASAAAVTWDGGGTTNNWSEAANWAGDVAPGVSDVATFNATSTKDATINAAVNVAGVDVQSGYTGTITQGSAIAVRVGTSKWVQAAGTFTGSSGAMTMSGFTLSGGTFTAPTGTLTVISGNWVHTAGGTFAHNNGTVTLAGTGKTIDVATTETFRNLTVNPNPRVADTYQGLALRQENGHLNWTGVVRCLPERLPVPFAWLRARKVFVNSLSDLFHRDVPLDFIRRVFAVMAATPWHTYQVLTKRADRLAELAPALDWPDNVWMGVSVESQPYASRVDHLRHTGAWVKFLSVEPLLGPVALDLAGIDWVITGGESGPHARPLDLAWAVGVRDQCAAAGVAFFHKQNGGRNKKQAGRLLDGRLHDAMPAVSAVAVPSRKDRRARAERTLGEGASEPARTGGDA